MGLLLICPHCHAKIALVSRTCSACGADLRNLPPTDRRYFIGKSGAAEAAPLVPEMIPGPNPESIEMELLETYPETMLPEASLPENKDVSLCEALDRILNKGAVLFGEVMISVADIDLVYLGLQVILASMETARGFKPHGEGQLGPNLFAKGAC
ncbi:MAG TPA: gas vesicle protein GvpJ [Desulfobaccales bacterium]|nr:gas vesicle protein GvpJ [Desulfobaccales bacterium]